MEKSREHADVAAFNAHQRESCTFGRRKESSNSRWNSGSGTLTDRPPLQPISCHEISQAKCASPKKHQKELGVEEPRPADPIRSLQKCATRFSLDYRSSFGMTPSHSPAHRRIIVGPSTFSAVNESLNDADKMKNRPKLLENRFQYSQLYDTIYSQIVRHLIGRPVRISCPFSLAAS
jgi:hypothetical protein